MCPETRILILADDLTGANDTAIQFSKCGFSTLVVTNIVQADTVFFEDYDVIAVNTNSRGMSPSDAYRILYEVIKKLEVAKNGFLVYKKVDSMLRGNPGQELAAVMDALDIHIALVAPAFPANRSVLEHGFLSSGANAVQIFADGSERKTENIPLETIRQSAPAMVALIHNRISNGTQILVADAVNDIDLETIYTASTRLEKPYILTGSAGLANQLARKLCKPESKNKETPLLVSPTPVLIVAGSRQMETVTQILTLSQSLSIPIIRFKVSLVLEGKSEQAIKEAYAEAAELMQRHIPICIIAVESMFHTEETAVNSNPHYTEGDETGKAISGALGILTKKLFDDFNFPLLISTGGDTSMAICNYLEITCLKPLKEIHPGIPLSRIIGCPYNSRFIITKSGRFGEPDTLIKILA
jgi:uncharacterized protein YgbK (DUF1537 family)